MNPTASKLTTSDDATKSSRPLFVLLLIAGVLTARWIWFAGIGDFGWTYEFGQRVLQGEVPYRDYISTLPQLTSYTIIPFIVLLKGNLWAFTIHLYLWWLASLLVGLQVARTLQLRPAAQASAMFFAACLSLPALHLGHAYSYAATFFFGLTLMTLLKYRNNQHARHLVSAGIWAGLSLLAKQNIGAVTLLLGGGLITYDCWMRREFRAFLLRGLLFSAGAALIFFPAFGYFASQAGATEVFRQMFSDAGAGKGGLSRMLFNLIPIWFFTPGTPHRLLLVFGISGTVTLTFLLLLGRKMYRLHKNPAPPANAATTPATTTARWISLSIGIVTALSVISLLDLPSVRNFFASLHPAAMYEFQGYTFPLLFLNYAFFTSLALVCLLSKRYWRQPEFFIPIFVLPLILWGHEMSCEGYLPLGAPLVVPLGMLLLEKTGLLRNTVPLACTAGIVMILGLSTSTQEAFLAASFKPLERLPADSKFAGLGAHPTYASRIKELHQKVAPRIQNHTTLWIHTGGPHQAFGGKAVFGPATMHLDTYHLRSEPVFRTRWTAQPPEFIFVGFQTPVRGSQLFTKEALQVWLPERYEQIWKSPQHEAELWQLRSSPTPH